MIRPGHRRRDAAPLDRAVRSAPGRAARVSLCRQRRSGSVEAARRTAAATMARSACVAVLHRPRCILLAGRAADAIGVAEAAVRRHPSDARLRTCSASRTRAPDGATRRARRSRIRAQRDPRDASIYTNLGLIDLETGQTERAVTRLGEALLLDPRRRERSARSLRRSRDSDMCRGRQKSERRSEKGTLRSGFGFNSEFRVGSSSFCKCEVPGSTSFRSRARNCEWNWAPNLPSVASSF